MALVCGGACGSDDDATSDSVGTVEPSSPNDDDDRCLSADQGEPADEYVGLDEAAAEDLAESQDLTLRVVGRDGECMAITMDLREDRVNVEIVDGTVVAAARF